MREEEIERKKLEYRGVLDSFVRVTGEKYKNEEEEKKEREMKKISRLLYAGEIIERAGLLYTFNEENLYKVLVENRKRITKLMK